MKQLADRTDVVKIVAGCVGFIFLYGNIVRGMNQPDFLEKSAPCTGCDGWAALHFLFFLVLGFLDPNRHGVYMSLGVAWELVETVLGQTNVRIPFTGTRLQLVGESRVDAAGKADYEAERWWYGRVTDVAFNAAGYILGSYLNGLIYGDCKVTRKK